MKFRNENDKLHFFGSMGLSFVLMVFFVWLLEMLKPGESYWQYWVLAYVLGFLTSNICGLIFEFLEHFVFHPWRDTVYWKDKPTWMKTYFSGDKWDHLDISLNFLGSTIFHPVIMLIKDLKRKSDG